MGQIDNCLASIGNSIARCFIPNREEHRGRGCCKRCGNPCRRVYKRCSECMGRKNYGEAPSEVTNTDKPPETQEMVEQDRI